MDIGEIATQLAIKDAMLLSKEQVIQNHVFFRLEELLMANPDFITNVRIYTLTGQVAY